MYLEDLFHVKNGISSNAVKVQEMEDHSYNIPYFRPTSAFENVIVGYINLEEVEQRFVFEAGNIFVSTDGDGSHSYAYVSPIRFIPNSNVSVLIPKREMSLNEKIFYAFVITKNRYRFSYGRKPKGERLKSLILPNAMPLNFQRFKLSKFDNDNFSLPINSATIDLEILKWQWFRYDKLFKIERGRGPRVKDIQENGTTPFITSIDKNNGLTGWTNDSPIHIGNVISVNRNGSVAEAFYQPVPFCSTEDVHIFNPKFDLNPFIALFLTSLIKKEKYRYSYGRKWGIGRMNESQIKLPVTETGEPDWEFMENYIKSLPYSKSL